MNKQSIFRVILNVVLIAIAVLSVGMTGFVSIKGYRSNRIPEIYSDTQITEVLKEEYSEFEFNKDDNWGIKTNLANDNKSFTVDVDIARTKKLCEVHYGLLKTFKLENETWKAEELPSEITFIKNEWNFDNSDWSVTAADGTKYEVSFLTDLEAKLYIQESPDSIMNEENNMDEELDNNNSEDADSNEDELNKVATCRLVESDDNTFLQGTFEEINEAPILLTVTEDSVKLMPGNEDAELIMEKK